MGFRETVPALSRRYRKVATVAVVVLTAVLVSSCMVGWTSNLLITHGDSLPCPPRPSLGWICILEIPEVGYLGINGYGRGSDATRITVRLAPLTGVTARWAKNEMIIVDRQSQIALQKVTLSTESLLGKPWGQGVTGYELVGYGAYIETEFTIAPRFREAEFRFPPIVVADKEVAVPPIQLRDGIRFPVLLPEYSEGSGR